MIAFIFAFFAGLASPSWSLAQRTGQQGCWVRLQSQSQKRICVSHRLWIEWLRAEIPPVIGQETAIQRQSTRWKSFSPLENFNLISMGSESGVKPVILTQYLNHLSNVDSPRDDGFEAGIELRQKVERVREKISELLAPVDRLGLLRSLILGEAISRGELPVFRRLGFVHLVSASGIHLYAILSGVQSLSRLTCSWARLRVSWGLHLGRVFGFLCSLALWVLGGARLGMLRPVLVIGLRSVARQWGMSWGPLAPLSISLVVEATVSLIRGEFFGSGLNSGRWIYALAVGGGLVWHDSFRFKVSGKWGQILNALSGHLGLAVGSWILVALVEVWETGCVSLATPILSLVTLPWVCLVVYPVTWIALVVHGFGWIQFSNEILKWNSRVLEKSVLILSGFSMSIGNLWVTSRWALLMGAILATFVVCFSVRPKAQWMLAALLILMISGFRIWSGRALLAHSSKSILGADQVVQLDVGQGDAALILGDHRQLPGLIDAGSEHALHWDDWFRILAHTRVRELSWVGITHLDEDHSGGLIHLSHLIPIRCVASSRQEVTSPRGERLAARLAENGVRLESWEQGCVPFPVFEPALAHSRRQSRGGNENMSAIWIPLNRGGFYLSAGDADQNDEIRIGKWAQELELQGAQLNQTTSQYPRLLKVSHHGSRYSTSKEFLNLIQPTEAWISCGQGNRYGHPSVQALNVLKQRRVRVRRTDEEGSIQYSIGH